MRVVLKFMALDSVVNKMSKTHKNIVDFVQREKEFVTLATFFATTRVYDTTTTLLNISESGKWAELAPASKYFMDAYGAELGLGIEQGLIGGLVILLGYYWNKQNRKKLSGNRVLKLAGMTGMAIGTMNLLDYFNVYEKIMPVIEKVTNLF